MRSLAPALAALALTLAPALAMAQDHGAASESTSTEAANTEPANTEPAGTDQSPGSAPPPPVAHDRPADRFWSPSAMAAAEMAMMDPHSAPAYSAIRVDLAEVGFGKGGDSYRWEGEGWTGDLNRLVLRTRGEGSTSGALGHTEVEAAYSRAISPWWNLQAGVRQDIRPVPARTHAMVGIEGLAPYRFDLRAALFLSDKGQWTARLEGSADQRITRRLVLQPRAELALSAQGMPAQHLGSGLTGAELGVRLRYEVSRQFAPYLGLSWTWATGRTAACTRALGEQPHSHAVVLGIKSWF